MVNAIVIHVVKILIFRHIAKHEGKIRINDSVRAQQYNYQLPRGLARTEFVTTVNNFLKFAHTSSESVYEFYEAIIVCRSV